MSKKQQPHQRTGLVGGRRYTIGWMEEKEKRAKRLEQACNPPSAERIKYLQDKKRQLLLPGFK